MKTSVCKVCGKSGHEVLGGVTLCPACTKECAGDDAILSRMDCMPSSLPQTVCIDCGEPDMGNRSSYLDICDACEASYDWDAIEYYLHNVDSSLENLVDKRHLFRYSTPGFWVDMLKTYNRFRGHCCRCSEIISKGNIRTFDGGTIWLCGACSKGIMHGKEDISDISLDSGNLLGLCSDIKSQQIHRAGSIMNQILLEVCHE